MSFDSLLMCCAQASWTESKPKLEKDPQGRATNSDLEPSDTEKLFREHVKMLYEVILQPFYVSHLIDRYFLSDAFLVHGVSVCVKTFVLFRNTIFIFSH